MWASIISAVLFVSISSCSPAQQSVINNSDTVLLKKDTAITTGVLPTVIPVSLDANFKTHYSVSKRMFLILDNASIINTPDGIYELYLASQPPVLNNTAQNKLEELIATLDLYSFTAPGAAKEIKVDITEQVKKIITGKNMITNAYFIIRFVPNLLANGSPSTNTGALHFSGIRIIQ